MGIFGRRREQRTDGVAPASDPQLQYPDELALEAADALAQKRPGVAAETYAKAIDKLHTMLVVTPQGSRLREPGEGDQPILDGYVAALQACEASSPERQATASTLAYLQEIANGAGSESVRYREAMNAISEVANE